MTAVCVPATTANLGPAFDALGLALSLTAVLGVVGIDPPTDRAVAAEPTHPAAVAFARAGGEGDVWVRSPIPMGRGLGYSGAMRVGGAALATLQRAGAADLPADARPDILAVAAALEGHADNAAPSVYGGLVATDGGIAVPVPLALDPDVVVWIPRGRTATDASRSGLSSTVSRDDAVANIGATAVLIAALAGGDVGALRRATGDRLHQPHRLAEVPASADALAAGLDHGAWCGWLSGSGPAVAFMIEPGHGDRLAAGLPAGGSTKTLRIDRLGVRAMSSP